MVLLLLVSKVNARINKLESPSRTVHLYFKVIGKGQKKLNLIHGIPVPILFYRLMSHWQETRN